MNAFLVVARQELLLTLRARWTQIFAPVFAALAIAVAASGYVLSGGHGVQDFSRTAASLVQLVLLLTPLLALLGGVLALLPEPGAGELLFSQPLARRSILLGKLAGLLAALIAAQAVGFGAAGAVVLWQAGSEGLAGFAALGLGAAALTAIFLGMAALLAAGVPVRRRARTLAAALVIWFGTVILFDVIVLGVATLLPSGPASRLLIVAAILNPVDAVRTGALLGSQGTTAFGSASLAFFRFTGGRGGAALVLGLSLAFWIAVPVLLAVRKLGRADL